MGRNKKSFNIDNLAQAQVEILSVQLGEKVREVCDKAVKKANKLLNKYNMECKMAFQIQAMGTFPEKNLSKDSASNLIDKNQI